MENLGIGSWLQRRSPKSGTKTAVIAGDTGAQLRASWPNGPPASPTPSATAGVAKGDRVAYLGENDPSFLETLFAAGLLGAVFVPLNTRLAPPEIQFQLQDCGAVLLVHAAALAGLAERGAAGDRGAYPHRRRRRRRARRGSAPTAVPRGTAVRSARRGLSRTWWRPAPRRRRTSRWAWTTAP